MEAVLAAMAAVASMVEESMAATKGVVEAGVAWMAEVVPAVGTGVATVEEVLAVADVEEGLAGVALVGVTRVAARLAEEVEAAAPLAAVEEPAADHQGCLGERLAVVETAGEAVAGLVEVE